MCDYASLELGAYIAAEPTRGLSDRTPGRRTPGRLPDGGSAGVAGPHTPSPRDVLTAPGPSVTIVDC